MINIIKLMFYLLRELVFDNKEEYDFKSAKFNTRKFIILIIILLSFMMNGWLIYRFVTLANDLIRCKEVVEENKLLKQESTGKGSPPVAKKPLAHSSDSGG